MGPFWDYWYFHVPNYVVAALIYTMLGRLVLGLFVPRDWNNYIWRFFRAVTDPVLDAVRVVTPGFVVDGLLPLVAVFWLFVIRLAYWVLLFNLGLAPPVEAPAS